VFIFGFALPTRTGLKRSPSGYPGGMNEKIEPGRPKAADVQEHRNAGDDAMEDDLTEERQPTPQERADNSDRIHMDP